MDRTGGKKWFEHGRVGRRDGAHCWEHSRGGCCTEPGMAKKKQTAVLPKGSEMSIWVLVSGCGQCPKGGPGTFWKILRAGFLKGLVKIQSQGSLLFNVARREIKFKESSKKFGMKFRDGCTAVVSPGVGVWGVGGFPGFQGASRASPPDPPICYPSLALILDPTLSTA